MTRRSNWVFCPECGHRMFWNKGKAFNIEIKCPSCKRIINLTGNATFYSGTVVKEKEGEQDVQK